MFEKEFFLILLPLFFVFHGYVDNLPYVRAADAFVLALTYCAATLVLAALFFFLFRSLQKAAVFTFLLMCTFFFFGPLHDVLKQVLGTTFLVRYAVFLPLLVLLLAVVFLYIKKKQRFNHFTRFTNLLLVLLILIDLVTLALHAPADKRNDAAGLRPCTGCAKPDIYFIVADEYAGATQLQEVFGFDNSSFVQQLEQRGFKVLRNTGSNYNYTPFSIASTLQMNYLSGLEGRNQSKADRARCKKWINHSKVATYLKQEGYTLKNFSVFYFDDQEPPAGSTLFTLAGTDLIRSQTLFYRLNRDLRFNTIATLKWKSEMKRFTGEELRDTETLYKLTLREAVEPESAPRFVYTHLMMPHYPYFFNSKGAPYPVETLLEGNQHRKEAYIEYLQYANNKLLDLVDQIKNRSKSPPVILLMSDHGFRHAEAMPTAYHFMNLNAVYLPQGDYRGFYDSMTNVNQFRVLLNTLFQQQLPLLKDSSSFLQE